jgi:hypothetical protein
LIHLPVVGILVVIFDVIEDAKVPLLKYIGKTGGRIAQ